MTVWRAPGAARRVLRSRSPEWGGCWVPLLSRGEGDLGVPWPVALRERHLHCIICKPDSPCPPVHPPPPPSSLPPSSAAGSGKVPPDQNQQLTAQHAPGADFKPVGWAACGAMLRGCPGRTSAKDDGHR